MKKVKEIMNREVITVNRYTTFSELLRKFQHFHTFPIVPVIEEDKTLVGVVRLQNLIDAFLPYDKELFKFSPFVDEFWDEDIFKMEIEPEMGVLIVMEDIMDHKFVVINQEETLKEAYEKLRLHKKEQMPVVDDQKRLVGIIGVFDIVKTVFKEKGII